MTSEYQQDFDDACLYEGEPEAGEIAVHVLSAMQRIEARREQMDLERMLKADYDFD